MNREVHVRICEGRGLRCPLLLGVVVSDVGKGALEVSGGDQEDDGCRRVETYKDDIETGVSFRSREEPGGCPPTGQAVSGMEAT